MLRAAENIRHKNKSTICCLLVAAFLLITDLCFAGSVPVKKDIIAQPATHILYNTPVVQKTNATQHIVSVMAPGKETVAIQAKNIQPGFAEQPDTNKQQPKPANGHILPVSLHTNVARTFNHKPVVAARQTPAEHSAHHVFPFIIGLYKEKLCRPDIKCKELTLHIIIVANPVCAVSTHYFIAPEVHYVLVSPLLIHNEFA